jgi:RhoGEF domain
LFQSCLQRPACTGLDLGALLLTPVQHMPRYVLLLRQLLQATPQASPEHAAISTCLRRLKDFLARLNDSMEHSFQLVATQVEAPKPQPSRYTSDVLLKATDLLFSFSVSCFFH